MCLVPPAAAVVAAVVVVLDAWLVELCVVWCDCLYPTGRVVATHSP
jgi:hypothetical protein